MSRKVTLEQVIENTGLGAKWEARGEARCKAKGKAEIARNLKKMGLTVSQIVEGTGLSPDEVARC